MKAQINKLMKHPLVSLTALLHGWSASERSGGRQKL